MNNKLSFSCGANESPKFEFLICKSLEKETLKRKGKISESSKWSLCPTANLSISGTLSSILLPFVMKSKLIPNL